MLLKKVEKDPFTSLNDVLRFITEIALSDFQGVHLNQLSLKGYDFGSVREDVNDFVYRNEKLFLDIKVSLDYQKITLGMLKELQKKIKSNIDLYTGIEVEQVNIVVQKVAN